jgi:hypothetical protein
LSPHLLQPGEAQIVSDRVVDVLASMRMSRRLVAMPVG